MATPRNYGAPDRFKVPDSEQGNTPPSESQGNQPQANKGAKAPGWAPPGLVGNTNAKAYGARRKFASLGGSTSPSGKPSSPGSQGTGNKRMRAM